MSARALAARRSRLLIYTAAALLIVYLALLLSTTYYSQRQLHEASHASLHAELEKRASALSYFYSERKADVSRLAREHAMSVFFSNRALGMSMEYGLRASLLAMRELVVEMVRTRTVERAPIYRRIVIEDLEGEILVDEGAAAGGPAFWRGAWQTPPETPELLVSSGPAPRIYLVASIAHRGTPVASIIAEVNHESLINELVQRQGETASYFVDLAGAVPAESAESPSSQGGRHAKAAGTAWHTEPIPDTPFEISLTGRGQWSGSLLGSEEYFYALLLLAVGLLALLGFMAWQIQERERALIASHDALAETNARLRKSQKQLVQSEKMASLGTLAAGVAHEINNPIGFIQANLTTLRDYQAVLLPLVEDYRGVVQARAAAEPELREQWERRLQGEDLDFLLEDMESLVADTVEGGRRVAEIVAGLRSFAHGGGSRDELMDVNDCVSVALSLASNELKYKAEVEQSLAELPPIRGSSGQITQVLVNLLVNAVQALDTKGGRVRVETLLQGDSVAIRVSDNGCGIAPEHLDQLFTPFFTTKEVGSGTGLGLSISQGLVESHGGSIQAESRQGEGTQMTVILPIERPPASAAAAGSSDGLGAPSLRATA